MELSATAVRRRITSLEEAGVIVTYTAVLDHSRVERTLEAYVELDFASRTDVQAFLADAVSRPEVREASTLAGQPGAILRFACRGHSPFA
jgi:Lrp/AsnC family leucine-responsive transcriptional regulator